MTAGSSDFALQVVETFKAQQESDGLAYYSPHKKQTWFHGTADYTYRYLRTGNRFGKSDCGAAEDVAFARGERAWLAKDDPNRYAGIPRHSTKGVILVASWDKAEEIYTCQSPGKGQGKLFKLIPKDALIAVMTNQRGNVNRIVVKSIHGGESHIYLDTVEAFKHNAMKAESSAWDFIHVDEPIPELMWKGFARGLIDRNGKAWFTCTPIAEPWINEFFGTQGRRQDGTMLSLDEDSVNITGDNKVVIIGSSHDNPYISRKGLADYESTLTENEKEARLKGQPLEKTGRVYHMLDEQTQGYFVTPTGWKSPCQPPSSWTVRYAIDPHPSTPHAVLFTATDPQGVLWVYDEIFDAVTGSTLAEMILARTHGYFVARAIADPSAWIQEPSTKITFANTLEAAGVHSLHKGIKDPSRGIIETTEFFAKGKIRISSNLRRLWYELNSYVWDRKKLNKPRDRDDHEIECLHRIVMSRPEYIPLVSLDPKLFQGPRDISV